MLIRDAQLSADQIERVTAIVRDRDVPLILEPLGVRKKPDTATGGRFSLPYSLAHLLVNGQLTNASYASEALADPAVRELAGRITYVTKGFESGNHDFPGGVEILCRDGRVLKHERVNTRGGLESPLPESEIIEKFRSNIVSGGASVDVAEDVAATVLDLENLSVRDLSRQLRRLRLGVCE